MRVLVLLNVAFLALTSSAADGDWPQFRGPSGDGRSEASNLPVTWGGFLDSPTWETPLPGSGWSSPIVTGDRVWIIAGEPTVSTDASLLEKLANHRYGKEVQLQADSSVKLLAVELDASKGTILRKIELFDVLDPPPIHQFNSYASPTPVTDGKRVYCHFGSLGTVCFAIDTGKILWQQRLVVEDITGAASSPVLCDDRLIVVCDGCDHQFVVALDKFTGKEIWRKNRPSLEHLERQYRRGFGTPLVVSHGGRKQVITPAAQWAVSYDPETGREWWRARLATGHAVVPRPVFLNGRVYVCSGYYKAELAAIRVDGEGDVSKTHVEWTYDKQVPLIASPVVAGEEIYFVSTGGIASCLDANTGELLWRQRLPGDYAASPLLADHKLYFTSKQGITTVVRPGRAYHRLAENKLFGRTMASLAIAGESLLIRTASALYCVRKNP